MKKFFMFLGIVLFSITTWAQELEINLEKPVSVPDCDLKGIPFRTYEDGRWIYHHMAGFGYSLILNSIGETLNLSPRDGINYFDKALSNPLRKNLRGYIGALSVRKDGTYCVSFSEKLSIFHGRFVCRIDSDWVLCRRDGCANPVLVYEPDTFISNNVTEDLPEPRDVIDIPSIKNSCDTIIIIVNCPSVDTNQCCNPTKLSWTLVYPMAGYRSTYDSPLIDESMFFGVGYRRHWRDSMQMFSTYAGAELVFFRSTQMNTTCDTCVMFTKGRPEKLALRWEVFVGREFGVFEKTNLRGFVEGRYALFQPRVSVLIDQKFLPKKSGLTLRGGVRYDFFQKFQLQGSYDYDPIANLSGGEVRLIFLLNNSNKKVNNVSLKNFFKKLNPF